MSGNRLTPRRVKLCRDLTWGLYKSVLSVLFLLSATSAFSMASLFSRRPRTSEACTQVSFDDEDAREALQRMIIEEMHSREEGALVVAPTVTHSPEQMLAPELTEEQKRTYVCHGCSWQDMMSAYKDAPYDARVIVDHLKKPLDPAWRSAFFVGNPGTGKTTIALAIPHLAHWYFEFIPSSPLQTRYRNEAREKLEQHLNRAVSSGKKVVVIIDEINRLLENFNSKSHDADATSSFLWMFLDSQKYNSNFFLIGTMNRDNKLPDPFKSRAVGATVKFKPIPPDKLKEIFKNKIISPMLELAPECNEAFLDNFVQVLQSKAINISPRDYESMRFKIARLVQREDPDAAVGKIKQHHIYRAMSFVLKRYYENRYGQETLTAEEWRDFNVVQSRIIDVKLQCAQKIPIGVNFGVCMGVQVSRPPGLDMDEAIKILEQEFSEDQKATYMSAMKKEYLIRRGFIDLVKKSVKEKAYKKIQEMVMNNAMPLMTFAAMARFMMTDSSLSASSSLAGVTSSASSALSTGVARSLLPMTSSLFVPR